MTKLMTILAVALLGTASAVAAPRAAYTVAPTKGPMDVRPFETRVYGNPFSGNYRSILQIAPEIDGLSGVRLPVDEKGAHKAITVALKFNRASKLLIGVSGPAGGDSDAALLAKIDFGKGKLNPEPVLLNGMSVTELTALDVYEVRYGSGIQRIMIPADPGFTMTVLGAVPNNYTIARRDAEIADQTDYEAFYLDGFAEGPHLFEVLGGPDAPVVEEGMPGTEGIQGGFEGGSIIEVNGTYHMFPTERAGVIGEPARYDRVKTKIGHWTSTDMIHWSRQSTIVEATGIYAVSHYDNPMNNRRSAIWSYMPVFSEENNRWYGHYLAYTTDEEISPNHSFGRIWRTESTVPGREGIGGPYKDAGIVIEPGLDSQWWEGRQGVASFFPYKVGDKWLSFISGAYPFTEYPIKSKRGWYVGLAESEKLEGPWTRLSEEVNPTVSIHPWFVENPIVSRLPNGLYIAVFDGGPEWLKLPNQLAYTLSKDGLNWTRARYIPIDVKVKKWWDTMRTPLCLMPVGEGVYNIVYAAIKNDRRYHPMGFVQVKMDMEALEQIAAGL